MQQAQWRGSIFAGLACLLLASCGGGGGGTTPSPSGTVAPVAAFSCSQGAPVIGQTVGFTDTSANTPTSWSWTFGDGATSTAQNPTHAYSTTGTFPVTLTVTNAAGADSVSRNLTVSAGSASIVPSIVATRLSGVAPLAVHFDATGTTAVATTEPFHDLEYRWDFGDASAGTWANGPRPNVKSKNRARGPVAAHVFETPGTYQVQLTVVDGTHTAMRSVQIAVADPATVFAATTTCISNDADFTGAPAGSSHVTSSDFGTALAAAFTSGARRILFKRGDTFNTAVLTVVPATTEAILIGAFGSGNRPIVRATANGIDGAVITGYSTTDCRVMDLEFDGNSFAMRGVSFNGPNSLALRLYAHDLGLLGAIGGENISVVECQSFNIVGGDHGVMSIYAQDCFKLALMGNLLDNNLKGEYCFRYQGGSHGVVQHNWFRQCGIGKSIATFRGDQNPDLKIPKYMTRYHVISDNWFDGTNVSSAQPVSICPQNNNVNEPISDVLFERNYLNGPGGSVLWIIANRVSVRNNLFLFPTAGGGCNAVNVTYNNNAAGLAAPTENRIYNNTVLADEAVSGLTGVAVLLQGTAPVGTVIKNNLVYAPHVSQNGSGYGSGPTAVVNYGVGTVTAGNSTDDQAKHVSPNLKQFLPASITDWALTTGSYALGGGVSVPVWSDFFEAESTATSARSIGAASSVTARVGGPIMSTGTAQNPYSQVDWAGRSDAPADGSLFSIWTKAPGPIPQFPVASNDGHYLRGDLEIYRLWGKGWSMNCIGANMNYTSDTAGYVNINTMLGAAKNDGSGSSYIGDYNSYVTVNQGDDISIAQAFDWTWMAWQVVVGSDRLTIHQWVKFGLEGAIIHTPDCVLTFDQIRTLLAAPPTGGTPWTAAEIAAWAPGDATHFAISGDSYSLNYMRTTTPSYVYFCHARMEARSSMPSNAELDQIARDQAPLGTAWGDWELSWKNGVPSLDDRSGNGHNLVIPTGGKLYAGELSPSFVH